MAENSEASEIKTRRGGQSGLLVTMVVAVAGCRIGRGFIVMTGNGLK
jgi:hypothetical protein